MERGRESEGDDILEQVNDPLHVPNEVHVSVADAGAYPASHETMQVFPTFVFAHVE